MYKTPRQIFHTAKSIRFLKYIVFVLLLYVLLFPSAAIPQEIKKEAKSQNFDWNSPLKKCWEFETEELTNIPLAFDKELIFIPTDKSIKTVSQISGKLVWETEISGLITGKILVKNGSLIIGSQSEKSKNSTITILDGKNGVPKKRIISEFYPIVLDSTDKSIPEKLIIRSNGEVISFDIFAEKVLLKTDTSNAVNLTDLYKDSMLLLGSTRNALSIMSLVDGSVKKRINIKAVPTYIFYTEKFGRILVGSKIGTLQAFDSETLKEVWDIQFGGEITDIKNYKDTFLVISKDNFLYSVKQNNGNIVWKLKLPGRIVGSSLINTVALAVLSFGNETALLINPETGKVINNIDFAKDTYFVSEPISTDRRLIIPTNQGLYGFSPVCSDKELGFFDKK